MTNSMRTTSHSDETEDGNDTVPEGVIDGIHDVVEGRLATKEDLADVLEF